MELEVFFIFFGFGLLVSFQCVNLFLKCTCLERIMRAPAASKSPTLTSQVSSFSLFTLFFSLFTYLMQIATARFALNQSENQSILLAMSGLRVSVVVIAITTDFLTSGSSGRTSRLWSTLSLFDHSFSFLHRNVGPRSHRESCSSRAFISRDA